MTVRIGVLGAARIAPEALLAPARRVDGAEVVAVAARDRTKAVAFAAKHRIARVHDRYEDLLADPAIDAIYNPLPNGLHGRWTVAALRAGKHVLCEKPFAASAAEAEAVKAVADQHPHLVVMEAFHWRYHPLARRMAEVVASGELGELRHVGAAFCVPIRPGDIRWRTDLAGGGLMDLGCYAVHIVRLLGGGEPTVVSAEAQQRPPGIDRTMKADLRFDGGVTGRVRSSMASARLVQVSAWAVGTEGELRVINPVAPQMFHRFSV